jgi:hypothetical protein
MTDDGHEYGRQTQLDTMFQQGCLEAVILNLVKTGYILESSRA